MSAYRIADNNKTIVLDRDDAPAHPCALYPERGIDTNTIHGETPVAFAERMDRKGWKLFIADARTNDEGHVAGWVFNAVSTIEPTFNPTPTRVLIGYDPARWDLRFFLRVFARELTAYTNRDCWTVCSETGDVNECVYGYKHAVDRAHELIAA